MSYILRYPNGKYVARDQTSVTIEFSHAKIWDSMAEAIDYSKTHLKEHLLLFKVKLKQIPVFQDMEREPESNRCVHTEHCCLFHGCKYGNQGCPVANGAKRQSHLCEQCTYYEAGKRGEPLEVDES